MAASCIVIAAIWAWLSDPAHWGGPEGVWIRIGEHLQYCAATLAIAALIAIPLGLYVGHTGKGRAVVVSVVNGMRSVPTLGLLFAAILLIGPSLPGEWAFVAPAIAVLVVLAIPPILAGAYTGVEHVDPGVRDAAHGMGMPLMYVLLRVELPIAMPLLFSGIRSAALQVIATATVAATVSVGGLGRLLIDGQALRDFPMMGAGAILIAVLALIVDGVFALAQRLIVSPGLKTPAAQANA